MRLIDADALENQFGVSDADLLALDEIRHAPTIDAEVVVEAKWIPGDKMPNYPRIPYQYNRHYCSACESPAVAKEHDRYDVVEFLTPRCPECGAYMRKGE